MDVSDDDSKTTSVFPCFSMQKEQNEDKCLFPIRSFTTASPEICVDDKNSCASELSLDWLENKSFIPEAAQKLHQIYTQDQIQPSDEEITIKKDSDLNSGVRKSKASDRTASKRKRRKKDKKHRHSKRRSIGTREDFETSKLSKPSKKVFIEDVRTRSEDAMYIDRQGDKSNVGFSSMYQYFVARYHPYRNLLSGLQKCNRDSVRKKAKKKLTRYSDSKSARLMYDDDVEYICCKTNVSAEVNEYICLGDVANNKSLLPQSNSDINPLGIYDPGTVSYIQGRGLEKSKEPCLQNSSTSSQIAMYNKKLSDSPDNISLWIEFINFQDEALEAEENSLYIHDKRKMTMRSSVLVEKKLSIVDKALEKNPKSVELSIFKMDLCCDIWDCRRLHEEWKKLSFLHPNNILIWKHYLLFAISNLRTFTVSSVEKIFVKCLETLKSIQEGKFISHSAPDDIETSMIEIFAWYAGFLRQCGHVEKSIALFQAMTELNFFSPDTVSSLSTELKIQFLETYWDSGSPRVGENGAVGWKYTMDGVSSVTGNSSTLTMSDVDSLEDKIISQKYSTWRHWLEIESLREREQWLPWQPDKMNGKSLEDCEDPDRVVVFEDISRLLFFLKSEETKFIFVLKFLIFLGLDLSPHFSSLCQRLHCHGQALFTSSESVSSKESFEYAYATASSSSSIPSLADLDDAVWKLSQSEYFAENIFRLLIPRFGEEYATDLKILFFKYKLQRLRSYRGDFTKVMKTQMKSLKKEFKSVLQQSENRNNIYLWGLYAELEIISGNVKDVRKILELSLSSQSSDVAVYAYRLYSEFLVGMDYKQVSCDKQWARTVLARCGCTETLNPSEECSPSTILRAKKGFNSRLQQLSSELSDKVSMVRTSLIADWLACYALFEYLSTGYDAAVEIYESALQDVNVTSIRCIAEQIYFGYLKLTLFHVNTTVSPLSTIQNILNRAIDMFPDNQDFLRLFIDIESRSFISGRQRRFFSNLLKSKMDVKPVSWVMAVYAELLRIENIADHSVVSDSSVVIQDGGSTWWLRSLFEKASRLTSVQHCVYFWRLYMKFEIEQGEHTRAKSIYYRALQHCPWSKLIYVDACKYFPSDLQAIHDLMVEKELRIRAPLDEIRLLETADKEDTETQEK